MPRAIETAEILAPALGGLEVRSECDFCEGHPGEADGLTWAELDERYPVESEWDGNTKRAPGWETWVEMGDRIAAALESLVERHPGETVVVACHGGVVVHSMFHYLGLDLAGGGTRAWIAPDNSSLTEFRFAPNPYVKATLPGAARPLQRPRPPRRARAPAALDLAAHQLRFTGGGIQRGSTSSLRLEGAHGEVDGAPQRVRAPEEQHRREARHEEAGDRGSGTARRSSMVSRNDTSIVTKSRLKVTIMLMPIGAEPVTLLALDREVAARAALAHLEERLEHAAAAAQRAASPQAPRSAGGGSSAASGQCSPSSRGSHAVGAAAMATGTSAADHERGEQDRGERGGVPPRVERVGQVADGRSPATGGAAVELVAARGHERLAGQRGGLVGERLDRPPRRAAAAAACRRRCPARP